MKKEVFLYNMQKAIDPAIIAKYGKEIDDALQASKLWVAFNMPDTIRKQDILDGMEEVKGVLWEKLGEGEWTQKLEAGMDVMGRYLADNYGDKITKTQVIDAMDDISDWVRETSGVDKAETFLQTEQPEGKSTVEQSEEEILTEASEEAVIDEELPIEEPLDEYPSEGEEPLEEELEDEDITEEMSEEGISDVEPFVEEPIETEAVATVTPDVVPTYKWEFPLEMEQGVAEGILDDYGFVNWNSDTRYDYSKIREKDLRNDEIRQAIITINPDISTSDLAFVAHQNTLKEQERKNIKREEEASKLLEKKAVEEDKYTLVASTPEPKKAVVEETPATASQTNKWEFPIEMEKGMAEAVLDDYGFVDWENEPHFNYSKIKEKDLENKDIRQAIITVNPNMVIADLEFVAHKNTVEAEEAKTIKTVKVETRIIKTKDGRALTTKEINDAVAWQQGIMHKLIFPPYGQNDIVNSRTPFPGVVSHVNARTAYKALLKKHKGHLPSTIVRDMGMMTFEVTGGNDYGKPKVKVIEREERKNTSPQTLSGV